MRVLYVATAYSRHPDDVITPWMGETIRRLRGAGIEAEVVAPSYRGLAGGVIDGVRVHRFRYAPRRWEDLTHDQTAPDRIRERPWYLGLVPAYVAAGTRATTELVRREGFDVVHVHWPMPHALFGLAARRATGAPLVLSFHGVELTWTQRQLPFLGPFLRHAIRTADAVTANSSHTAGLIRNLCNREVVRIPFGATVEPTGCEVTSTGGREADSAFEVLFVGRLVERKGVHYLLEAIKRLRTDRPVRLRVVGDGPMRAALEERARRLGIADRVHFEGFVASDVLARRFAGCDAFVLPAVVDAKGDVEGLGVVLIEAMMHGKPVIASNAGGIVDIVRDGESGILVSPGDPAALAAAIEALVTDDALRRSLAGGGRRHVEREFSWSTIIERLARLYRSVAQREFREPEPVRS